MNLRGWLQSLPDPSAQEAGIVNEVKYVGPEQLAEQGISAEVIDPRTIKPLDVPLILQSVARTGRVLLVQEAPKFAGFMAEVAATIAESEVFGDLQAPIRRLCGLDTPIPYSPTLEKASVPQVDDIVREAAALVGEW